MPPGFEFPTARTWSVDAARLRSEGPARPLAPGAIADRGRAHRAGRDAAAGAGRDQRAAGRIAAEFKDSNAGWTARVVAAHEQLVGASRPALMVLMGAGGLPAADRLRQHGEPAAGAAVEPAPRDGRSRGAGRIAVGSRAADHGREHPVVRRRRARDVRRVRRAALARDLPEARLPRIDAIQIDGGVLFFTIVSRSAWRWRLDCAGAPGRRAKRSARQPVGIDRLDREPYARRLLSGWWSIEVALALVLLVGAGLMTRSFSKLLQVNPGFESDNVSARRCCCRRRSIRDASIVALLRGRDRAAAPRAGVTTASAVSTLPMSRRRAADGAAVQRRRPAAAARRRSAGRRPHGGARLLRDDEDPALAGRFLDERDDSKAPRTSVINETMARRYFPDRSPLGQIIQNPHGKSEVVGVVADVRNQGLDREPKKQVYLPLRQSPTAGMAGGRAHRAQDPLQMANTIQRVIWTSIPGSRSTS